mmetsp:Transcript_1040/g.2220  ORF Transcript_1040/g.2220 Transcript_1040/m.2220 type:complete len:115 (-) Transcript_1040:1123-1467(-)
MASGKELACVYASLILHEESIDITAENISSLIKAAGVEIEGYWPGLFAKLLAKVPIENLISSVGAAPAPGSMAAGGGGASQAAAAGGPAEEEKEEKKEEPEEEEDEDMGFSLFD